MLWEDQLPTALLKHKQEEGKIPITQFNRGDRILLPSGRIGQLTGYKTKQNVQVKIIGTDVFEWLSVIASVHKAK